MKKLLSIFITILLTFSQIQADGNERLRINLPIAEGPLDVAMAKLGRFDMGGQSTVSLKLPEDSRILSGYIYLSGFCNLAPAILISNGRDSSELILENIGLSQATFNQYVTYRVEVTDYIIPGENQYQVSVKYLPFQPNQGLFYGGCLIVIYELEGLPQVRIYIADGLDYFCADSGYPVTKVVNFPFSEGLDFSSYAEVGFMVGMDYPHRASGLWHKSTGGDYPGGNIMDMPLAIDYNNSSNTNPNIDTNPFEQIPGQWDNSSLLDIIIPVTFGDCWMAFQLESQVDNPLKEAFEGCWNFCVFKLPLEPYGYGKIGDRVWYDRNANALQDSSESGIPGILVCLHKNWDCCFSRDFKEVLVDSIYTNQSGNYLFQYLTAGSYYVTLHHPLLEDSNMVMTFNSNPSDWVTISDFDEVMDIDFGYTIKGNLHRSQARFELLGYKPYRNYIEINWKIKPGTGNLGFDIYRSVSGIGDRDRDREIGIRDPKYRFHQLNDDLIPLKCDIYEYYFIDCTVRAGIDYYYKIVDVGLEGKVSESAIIAVSFTSVDNPQSGDFSQQSQSLLSLDAYPNPFNSIVNIRYGMLIDADIEVAVYNILGNKVKVIASRRQQAGEYDISWNGEDQPSGIYFIRLNVGEFSRVVRVVLIR